MHNISPKTLWYRKVYYMDEINLSETLEHLASYGIEVWIGVFAAIFVFIIELILDVKYDIFSSGDRKIEKARKEGKMLKATRISCSHYYKLDGKGRKRVYMARYEYYIGERRKTKAIVTSMQEPLRTLTLYYTTSPNKVFSQYDIKGSSPLVIIIYILPIVVAFFVMKVFGFNG